MHNRPAARREVAGPKRARRAVNERGANAIEIEIVNEAATEIMATGAMRIGTAQNKVAEIADTKAESRARLRIRRAAENRGIVTDALTGMATIAAGIAPRDRVGLPIAIAKSIARRALRVVAPAEMLDRPLHEADAPADLRHAPVWSADQGKRRPQSPSAVLLVAARGAADSVGGQAGSDLQASTGAASVGAASVGAASVGAASVGAASAADLAGAASGAAVLVPPALVPPALDHQPPPAAVKPAGAKKARAIRKTDARKNAVPKAEAARRAARLVRRPKHAAKVRLPPVIVLARLLQADAPNRGVKVLVKAAANAGRLPPAGAIAPALPRKAVLVAHRAAAVSGVASAPEDSLPGAALAADSAVVVLAQAPEALVPAAQVVLVANEVVAVNVVTPGPRPIKSRINPKKTRIRSFELSDKGQVAWLN